MNIVELQGTTGAAPANDRKEGFAEAIAASPNLKIVASQTGDFTRSGGKQVMEAFLKSQPQIDVVYAHNDDMALGAIEAIEAAGKVPGQDIKIVSVDAVKDGMQALADGKINFIVECNPLLGPQLMDLAKKVKAGEDGAQARGHGGDDLRPGRREGRPRRAAVLTRRSTAGRSPARPGAGWHGTAPRPSHSAPRFHERTTMTTPPNEEPGAPAPVVQMTGIEIGFPGVKALDGVDFRLLPGEVHALMGENGAGKSTLIKALTGVYGLDAGTITVRGREQVVLRRPAPLRPLGSARCTRRSTSART